MVLSLWRGEMCTASFRMPLEDVGRLLDTLDDGYAEAGGDELVQSGQHVVYPQADGGQPADYQPAADYQQPAADYQGDYPETGHYARPPQRDYQGDYPPGDYAADYQAQDYQGADYQNTDYQNTDYQGAPDYQTASDYQSAPDYQGGPEYRGGEYQPADYQPADYQPADYGPGADYHQPGGHYGEPERPLPPQEERPAAALGPNDVLVARGTPPTDKLVAGHSTAPDAAVPRENMIVGDSLPYGQPPHQPSHHGTDPGYPMPAGDPYGPPQDAYGTSPSVRPPAGPRSQSGGPPTDPYGFPADEVDQHDPYAQGRTYGRQVPHPDPYGTPSYPDDRPAYGDPQPGRGAPVDPADPLGLGQGMYATGERLRPEHGRPGHDDRDSRTDW
ncbi:hypothetical protein GCM10023259_086000 [Thermocatellispora tengchongensis]